jgi:PAS domain S-box-containing protein
MNSVLQAAAHVSLFLCAVMFSAWFGGFKPGLLAIGFSLLTFKYYFLPPIHSLELELTQLPRLVLFSLSGLFVSSLSAAQKIAAESLRQARDDLQERSRELERINAALQAENIERKRAEDALRRQANLLEQVHEAILVCELPGTIIYWNRGAEQLYGFSREEAIGRLSHDLLRTEHAIPMDLLKATIERHGTWTGELTQTTRDGRKVVVDSRCVLVHEADGRRLVLETNRDITERKRAEYLTGQVFESLPDGVAIIGRDYRYQQVNPVYERQWRMSAERIVGRHVADVVGMDVFEQTAKPHLDRCFDGEEGGYAGWFSNALGRRYVAGTCSPLRPHSEPVESALVIVRDLTEHMLASEALREAQAELAHVTRVTTLGEVTASFAHELNQPLAAILNNANACLGLLPSGRADLDEVRDALADIVTDADRASAIIERVRGLAKRSSPEQVPLQLVDVVADIVALAAAESVARRVAIRTDIPADLPVVLGDRVQLQQVLLNLVVNGMDAMSTVDEPERKLEIRGRPDTQDGSPAARISVQDRGIGLHAGQADRLFEAFYTTKPHGMGMGLAISRSIIEAHGGRLWAESNRGPGATFSFRLPAAAASAAA